MELKYLKGIGPKKAEAFEKIGIKDLTDFLAFVPRTYAEKVNVSQAENLLNHTVLICGKIEDIERPGRPVRPTILFVRDHTGLLEIPVFGDPKMREKQFHRGDTFIFYGKISQIYSGRRVKMDYRDHLKINPLDAADIEFLKYKLIPIYELSSALKATWIRPLALTRIVFNAFKKMHSLGMLNIQETIPQEILQKLNLISKGNAVVRINFPHTFDEIEAARRRLSFEELFYLQLLMALRKESVKTEVKGIRFTADVKDISYNFVKMLNFDLTNAQKRVINEIYLDMKSERVMNRLLQGDVGSGKTIVSFYCMLIAIYNGYQVGFMCPTEILAEQHYATMNKLVKDYNAIAGTDFKVVQLVGGQKKKLRAEILNDIKSGKANIIVGTHALIQEAVEYKNLGFIIIDEQHKFGVMQRAKLKEKGLNPDVLVMTATPIPRTLALTFYGDLDVSVINEMPLNRKPIITNLFKETEEQKVWSLVKEKLREGRQAFIVYPIIEESEKLDLKSAEENFIYLKDVVFRDYRVGIVHGRKFWYEIDETMQDFKNKKIDLLVSTTVIEVGIDIPNATMMIIEEAQRFGLSQLHQLRGRVGRGSEQSYCFLIAKHLDEISRKRLEVMCQTNDGFKISETDMEIRGPGEFYGTRQSGILNFLITDLNKDKDILDLARKAAFEIVETDTQLRKSEHQVIRDEMISKYKDSLYLMNIA